MTLATTGWMQVSRGEEEEEMVWAVPTAPSGTREKQIHKPDLENWVTGKDSFGHEITTWEATVPPEAWRRCAAGRREAQACSPST